MLFALAVTVAYVPGLIGGALPTGWVILWLAAPLLMIEHRISMTPAHWLGLSFLCYAGLSLAWSPNGMLRFMQLLALGAVFAWASDLSDIRRVLKGLAIGLGVSGLVTLAQVAGYQPVSTAEGSEFAGLFVNRNVLAEVSALLAVLLIAHRMSSPWLAVTLPGLAMSSRTVLLALGAAAATALWYKSRRVALVVVLGAVLVVAAMLASNVKSSNERVAVWQDTWQGLTWSGHGVGSFQYLYPKFATNVDTLVRRPQHAHNDLLELVFELGVGVIPLVLGVVLLLGVNDVNRAALVCFLVMATFSFPLNTPVTGFMAAVVAGQLSRRLGVVRLHGAGWRSALSVRVPS